jgi:hypothetical protein
VPVALVGSYELLMVIIRGTRAVPKRVPETDDVSGDVPVADPLQVQAADTFAEQLSAGRVRSIRAIRSALSVGQPCAQQIQAYLGSLADT